jgi:hypothetical protein
VKGFHPFDGVGEHQPYLKVLGNLPATGFA